MKTLGDLRQLIKDNGGSLKFGNVLEFKYSDGNDVDIRFDDELVAWFRASYEDSCVLSDDICNFNRALRILT